MKSLAQVATPSQEASTSISGEPRDGLVASEEVPTPPIIGSPSMLMSAFLGIVASPEVKGKTLSNKHPHYTFPHALHNYSPQLEVVGGVEGGRSYIYEGKVEVASPYYWA